MAIFDHAHPKIIESTFSMQKTSLFHLLIFKIQSISESHDQTSHTHFWQWPLKKLSINF